MSKIKKAIEQSNIVYHTQLSKNYDKTQPHFNRENVIQVQSRLKEYSQKTGGKRLMDLGCGTGFILEIAKPYFKELYGVDITPSMLKIAEDKFKNVKGKTMKVILANSDEVPFGDKHFDVVTANGFLHHLPDLYPTFKEAYRILKNGGVFYSDQDPNYYFWQSMYNIRHEKNISPELKIERDSVCKMSERVQGGEGITLSSKTIEMAEYQKTKGGFKEELVKAQLKKAGFKKISYEYFWFWQEGAVIRNLSLKAGIYFEDHLRKALPVTRGFFKYVRIIAYK